MSLVQTKHCRDLVWRKAQLEELYYFPPARHLIYLIDSYIEKSVELEQLLMRKAQLEDKIHCAEEFLKLI